MSVIYIDSYRFGAAYDPDAAAYIARVEGASGDNQALEIAVKDAINAFVVGCKADGIWNAIKASAILAGARTLNGALQPLVGTAPTNFNFVAGDYDRKTGLKGNASTKYLNSNRNNNVDPQNSQHLAVYVTQLRVTASKFYLASDYGVIGTSAISDVDSRSRNTSFTNVSGNVLGLVANSRSLGANYTYRSGGTNSSISKTSQAPGSSDIHVFASSNTSVPARTDARLAFYSIGESLDLAKLDSRVTTLINAFAAAIP